MPEYLAPGVYTEEIDIGSKPIEGVSTSTAGFAGETERGPTSPTLITGFTQFERIFGGYAWTKAGDAARPAETAEGGTAKKTCQSRPTAITI